ncbi:hypothetical protein AB0I22_16800 [Streptomyces sp. NPDC050610]|uniref:hypothetical protein n=1 Tax=Streptomyces sp. NPDC050610 TaxID=3157097 RepID=UPI003420BFC5
MRRITSSVAAPAAALALAGAAVLSASPAFAAYPAAAHAHAAASTAKAVKAAKAATVCEAVAEGNEVKTADGWRAVTAWNVSCTEDRTVRVEIEYMDGRTVSKEQAVAAGAAWNDADVLPTARGVNCVVSFFENGEPLTHYSIVWD